MDAKLLDAIGGAASGGASFLNSVASLAPLFSGGLKSQTSWRDAQHQQNLIDRLLPNQISNANKYLEGTVGSQINAQNRLTTETTQTDINREKAYLQQLVPEQAAAHNTYQDMTYGEDTQRAITRTNETGEALGMSPWELMGQQQATPLPTTQLTGRANPSTPQRPEAPDAQFLNSVTQLQQSENANRTALMTTRMNNDTALEIERLRQGKGALAQTNIESLLQGIDKSKQDILESKARTALATTQELTEKARIGNVEADTKLKFTQEWSQYLNTIKDMMGTETVDFGFFKQTSPRGRDLLGQMAALGAPGGQHQQSLDNWAATLSDDDVTKLSAEVLGMAKAVAELTKGGGSLLKMLINSFSKIGK